MPLPSPITYGLKWLYHHPEYLALGVLSFYDNVTAWVNTENVAWRKVVWRFARQTPALTTEDLAVFDMHITNITGGNLDTSWTDADYTAVEQKLTTLETTLLSFMNPTHTLTERRYYQMAFNPDVPQGEAVDLRESQGQKPWKRFARSGPAARIFPRNIPGQLTGAAAPYQVAMSVTLKTATRPHWGRVYLPGVGSPETTSFGRFNTGTTQPIANAFDVCADTLADNDFQLVVPATQQDSKFAFALNAVTGIQVDDIPDTIHRRRPKQPAVRSIGTHP